MRFWIEMTALALFSDWILYTVCHTFFHDIFSVTPQPPPIQLDSGLSIKVLVAGFIIAPVIETLLTQWIPIRLSQLMTDRKCAWILISAVLFGLGHIVAPGVSIQIAFAVTRFITTFSTGIILAWSFTLYQRRSFFKAFWITAWIHALVNIGITLRFAIQ